MRRVLRSRIVSFMHSVRRLRAHALFLGVTFTVNVSPQAACVTEGVTVPNSYSAPVTV